MSIKACVNKSRQVITTDLINTVLKDDEESYFTCGYEEHILVPVIYTYINLRAFQHLLNNIQLLKKSFNTEGQWQNITSQPIDISTIVYITI